jgi:hypothetical protein
MSFYANKLSNYTGQVEQDRLGDYLLSVDIDLTNLFNLASIYYQFGTGNNYSILTYTSTNYQWLPTIGGWNITGDLLYGGSGANYIGLRPNVGIWMGDSAFANAVFSVDPTGQMIAHAGRIGGWYIGTNTLSSTNLILDSLNQYIESADFISGSAGRGWRLDPTTAQFGDIRARGKITCSVFEKEAISSVGGNLLVLDSDVLTSSMTALETSTITISGDTSFAIGDILRIKDGIDDEWFVVLNSSSSYTYNVNRDAKGDYATDSNPSWEKGVTVVNYKNTGGESDPYSVLMLHFNGADGIKTATDYSLSNHVVTFNGDAQIDTAQKKFGGSSLLLDGNSDCVTIPDSTDFNFGSSDFTIDFWVKKNGDGVGYYLLGQSDANASNATSCVDAGIGADDVVSFSCFYGAIAVTATSSTTLTGTDWHHLAFVRDGTTTRIFIDGVADGTASIGTNTLNDSSTIFAIGRKGLYASDYFNGWIDEFRISKGVARWTKNFQVPSVEYTSLSTGGILLTSSEKYSPYIDFFTHEGNPWSNTIVKTRIGNLNGIAGASDYGIWAGAGFLGKLQVIDLITIASSGAIRSNIEGEYPYLEFSNDGLQLKDSSTGGTYGTAIYGTDLYGYGALVWILNNDLGVPWAELKTPTLAGDEVASMRLYNRASLPSGSALRGDLCVVSAKLYICTADGTPGTWTVVGSQS